MLCSEMHGHVHFPETLVMDRSTEGNGTIVQDGTGGVSHAHPSVSRSATSRSASSSENPPRVRIDRALSLDAHLDWHKRGNENPSPSQTFLSFFNLFGRHKDKEGSVSSAGESHPTTPRAAAEERMKELPEEEEGLDDSRIGVPLPAFKKQATLGLPPLEGVFSPASVLSPQSAMSPFVLSPLPSHYSCLMDMNGDEEEDPDVKVRVHRVNGRTGYNVPHLLSKSDILSDETFGLLESSLPSGQRGYNWVLRFSLTQHGANYIQFFDKVKNDAPTYLIVETIRGEVFGGYASSAWKVSSQYYGDGQCFVFHFGEQPGDKGLGEGEEDDPHCIHHFTSMTQYMWSGLNTYFQWTSDRSLGLGGGGGAFGLFLGDDFEEGTSGRSQTFENVPLCTRGDFRVQNIEVWGFTHANTETLANIERAKKTKGFGTRGR